MNQIYASLPWWAQNVACSLRGFVLIAQRYGKLYRLATRFLEDSQWWPLEKQQEYQNRKLREMIDHAYRTVPYYREIFDHRNLCPEDIRTADDLPKLPILDKETVRARYKDLICTTWPKKRIMHSHTGGTTGKALDLAYDRETLQFQFAVWRRHQRRFGIGDRDSSISFSGRSVVPLSRQGPPFWRRILPMRRTFVSVHHMTKQNMPALVEYLQSRRVRVYVGYPSALYLLAVYLLEKGIRLKHPPEFVVTGAETLLPHIREALEISLGATVTDQYGASEYCGNISQCEKLNYHVDMEFGVVELLPDPNLPDNTRRIVLTGLQNPVMPLVRYDIQDLATVTDQTCSCGRASPIVLCIDGRIESYIVTPDGRQLGRMDFLFKETPKIREAQLIQTRIESMTFRLAVRPGWDGQDEQKLLADARRYLGDQIAIDFEYVDEVPREPNGKFRQIVSSVFGQRMRNAEKQPETQQPEK